MDSPHVVHLINSFLPRLGGAEQQLAALAPALEALGWRVTIVARRYPGMAARGEVAGTPIIRPAAPGPKATASLAYSAGGLWTLRRLRPSLLHAHELFSTTTTAVIARAWWGMPLVVTPHRSGPPGDVQRLGEKWGGGARLRYFSRAVDRWITISSEIGEELKGAGVPPDRCVPIPNGVDSTHFAPLPSEQERRAQRRALGLPEEAPIVLFAGRLAAEKRVGALVALWPAIRAAHPDALLLLLGSGPEEERLRAAAGEGVLFAGRVGEVVPFLQVADIFVLPSVAEGLSVALLEALSCGLPVVATAVGGAPDVLEEGQNGLLVPPDAPAPLRAALLALLADPALRARLGAAARQTIEEGYALPVVAGKLDALYRALLAEEA